MDQMKRGENKEALSFVVIGEAGINIKMAEVHVGKSKRTLGGADDALGKSTAFRRSALSSHFLTLTMDTLLSPLGTPFF